MTNYGGKRTGAGRPKGSEPSTVKRLPLSLVNDFDAWIAAYKSHAQLPKDVQLFKAQGDSLNIPLFADKVQAGFPSPADPYISNYLDFNDYLVSNPSATFAVYADGHSMIDAGIAKGDLLVVDRSIEAKNNDIVLVSVNNEFTVKRLIKQKNSIELHPENASGAYSIIIPDNTTEVVFVGVVTHIIKKV